MRNGLSILLAVTLLCFGAAVGFCGNTISQSEPLVPPGEAPTPTTPPIVAVPTLDISVGIVGLALLPHVNGAAQLLPNFGPFFRVAKNIFGYKNPDGSWHSYVDGGGVLFANVSSNTAISSDPIYNLGIGIGLGFLDDVITVSFAFDYVLGNGVSIPTYAIVVSSSAFKF